MPTNQEVTNQLASPGAAGSAATQTILFFEEIKFFGFFVILLFSHLRLAI